MFQEAALGAALPPIPPKLVARIEAGEFINMGNCYQTVLESHPAKPPQKPTVSGILEWIRCFNIYMAVISHKQPTRIPVLLAYETLIIKAHMEYCG